jgi:DNA-binding MarR family transcriptional regulator
MVVSIADSHEPHVIGLAKELGITKGAVSQIVKKLERKGIVKRNIDINNRSKYLLTLTAKGLLAYNKHEKLHQSVNLAYMHILQKYPDGDIKNILQILKELNNEVVGIN